MKYINRREMNSRLKKQLNKPFVYAYGVENSGKSDAIRHYLKNDKQLYYQWFKLVDHNLDKTWDKIYQKLKERCFLDQRYHAKDILQEGIPADFCFELKTNLPLVMVIEGGKEEELNTLLDIFWELSGHGKQDIKVIFIHTIFPSKKIQKFIRQGNCGVLTQQDFLFQRYEIQKFYESIGQSVDSEALDACIDVCNGWIAMMKVVRIDQMKYVPIQDIRLLMDEILADYFSIKQLTSLMKISFLETFELDQLYYLTKDKGLINKILLLADGNLLFQEMEGFEKYRMLPPFRKLLLQRLNISRINQQELYRNQTQWLIQKQRYLDALKFLNETNNHDTALEILAKYPNPMYFDLAPELMMDIYRQLPRKRMLEHIFVYLQVMCDYLLIIDPVIGAEMLQKLQEHLALHGIHEDEQQVLGEIELIMGYASYNNLYDMCEHFKTAFHLLFPNVSRLSTPDMVISFGSPSTLYQYLTTAGDANHLIAFATQEINYYTMITQGLNRGLEKQMAAELQLECGNYKKARVLAENAYHDAFSSNIKYMCVCSLFTIGRVSILLHDDSTLYKVMSMLQEEKDNSRNIFLIKEIESAIAYLSAIDPWNDDRITNVIMPHIETQAMDPTHHSFSYIAQGQIYIHNQAYDLLYTLAIKMELYYQQHQHVLGDIYTNLYKAIALHHSHQMQGAKESMIKVLEICEQDHLLALLVEQGSGLLDILNELDQNAFVQQVIVKIQNFVQFKIFNFNEKEALVYMYHKKGYSRANIAKEMDMSIYAVKYYLQSIRKKTGGHRITIPMDENA